MVLLNKVDNSKMHKSTKWLIGMVLVIFLMGSLSAVLPNVSREENLYLHDFYKSLHILGAVLFLGNIIITGIWMFLAEKSKNVPVIQFATKAVNWMDVFFTAPGAAMILLSGLVQAPHHGGVYTQSWILMGLILFSLSGVIWLIFLIPDQHRLINLSHQLTKTGKLPTRFFQVLHRWYFWGILATILPIISLIVMILKPKLW